MEFIKIYRSYMYCDMDAFRLGGLVNDLPEGNGNIKYINTMTRKKCGEFNFSTKRGWLNHALATEQSEEYVKLQQQENGNVLL